MRVALWVLALCAGLLWFASLGQRALFEPDEGRYAEVPREMVASGDWLTPRLNGLKFFDKPPLQYWATATAYTLFGVHEGTARLWPALTGLLALLATAWAGARLYGAGVGLAAAAILGGSLLYIAGSNANTLDMGVAACLTVALMLFLVAQHEARPRLLYGVWTVLALAVLSKGLIGWVLPAGAIVLYALWQRDLGIVKGLRHVRGLALCLTIAAPWFVAVSLANPEFPGYFFVHEHFERFTSNVHARNQPAWYYLAIVPAGFLPWPSLIPGALRAAGRASGAAGFDATRFLLVWIVTVFAFFSLSHSKLPLYILPLFPALALLLARHALTLPGPRLAWHLAPAFVAGAGLLVVGLRLDAFAARGRVPAELYAAYQPWLLAAAGVLLLGGGLAFRLARRARRLPALFATGLAALLALQLAFLGLDSLSPVYSGRDLARLLAPALRPDLPVYSVETFDRSLPFYLQRPVIVVQTLGELELGVQQEPGKWLPDRAAFLRAWARERQALAVMELDTFEALRQAGVPMRELARSGGRVAVAKP